MTLPRRRKLIAMTLLCSAAGVVSSQARAAEWLFDPTVRVSREYTDNPRLLEEGESSLGTVGEMSANVRRRSPRLDWSLRPRARAARYADDETLNSTDQYLDAELKYMNERSQWSGSLNVTHDTTLTSELGLTGFVQTNKRHEGLSVSLGPTFMLTDRLSLGGQASWMESHYPDARFTGLVDYDYRALSLFSQLTASERSRLTLTVQGGELNVPDLDSRTRDGSLRLAWTYEPLSLWTAELSAGPSYVDASFGTDTGMVFDSSLRRTGERWTVSVDAGRNLTPTGRGVLTRRDKVSLGVTRRITEYMNGAILAQGIRNQDLLQQPGVVFDEVTYARLELSMSWRIAELWSIALAVSGVTQSYESRPYDADNYRASLSVIWNGQQHSL